MAHCRFGQVLQARSSVTCVAVIGFGSPNRLTAGTFAPDAVTSVVAGGRFAWRAQASGLRSFGLFAAASRSPASFAPNHSFKPTPSRGFVETLRGPRNTGSRLPRSARLNSGVRRSRAFGGWLFIAANLRLRLAGSSVGSPARSFFGYRAMRAHISHALRLSASEAMVGSGCFARSRCGCFGSSRLKIRRARPSDRASVFGKLIKASFSPASRPPNKSFKPTPYRGFVEILLCLRQYWLPTAAVGAA